MGGFEALKLPSAIAERKENYLAIAFDATDDILGRALVFACLDTFVRNEE
jgi:hypothetical protein